MSGKEDFHVTSPPNQHPGKTNRGKGRKGQYRSSFMSWKDQLLHPPGEEKKRRRPRTVDRLEELPLEDDDSLMGAHLKPVLEDIASKIVRSVVERQTQKLAANSKASEVHDSSSSHSLVENLALGVVSSLLGLDNARMTSQSPPCASSVSDAFNDVGRSHSPVVPPPSARPFSNSSLASQPTLSSESLDASPSTSSTITSLPPEPGHELPLATYNLVSALVRPPAAIPRRRSVKSTEDKKYQQLSRLLSAPTDYSNVRRMSPCEDNAVDHPHRVPSPSSLSSRKMERTRQPIRSQHSCGLSNKNTKCTKPIPVQQKKNRLSLHATASPRNTRPRRKTIGDAMQF